MGTRTREMNYAVVLWMPSVSFCCGLSVGTEVNRMFNHAALASKGRQPCNDVRHIPSLYFITFTTLYASLPHHLSLISPESIAGVLPSAKCRRAGSLKDTADTPSRESLHYLQLFSVQGKWYPIYFFLLLLLFVFHDLCFLFSAMSSSLSLSGSLSLSCRQCCCLKFLSSWLLMLKVGIQWEMERRKNIASFITLVVFLSIPCQNKQQKIRG